MERGAFVISGARTRRRSSNMTRDAQKKSYQLLRAPFPLGPTARPAARAVVPDVVGPRRRGGVPRPPEWREKRCGPPT